MKSYFLVYIIFLSTEQDVFEKLIKHILFLTVRDCLPDAAAPVGHSGAEVMDAGGLVKTSQTPLIILQLYIVYFIHK